METNTDFKISDDFKTDWEHNKRDALAEMYAHADCISGKVEHLIDINTLTLSIDDIDIVSAAIKELKELAEYNYIGERVNMVDYLNDSFGYVWEDKS
jgi:hypothetical protein